MMVSKGLMRPLSFGIERGMALQTIVMPAKAGIQYAAAVVIERQCLWNTGSPAFAGEDD